MENLTIKDLYRKDGKLNAAITRRPWFKDSALAAELSATGAATLAEQVFLLQEKVTSPSCSICAKPCYFDSKTSAYDKICRSRSCSAIDVKPKTQATMIEKYGAKISPKSRQAIIDRSAEFVRKSREALRQKHGVENPSQLKNHFEKSRSSLFKNYGVDHPSKIERVKILKKDRSIDFYSSLCDKVSPIEIIEPTDFKKESYAFPCHLIKFTCDKHGEEAIPSETFKWRARSFDTTCSTCLRPFASGSLMQQEIATFIESLGFKIRFNNRQVIAPLELDIVVEEKKLAIEFNGLFWHSSLEEPSKDQHLLKTELCEAKGFQLIQIFEDEWLHKKDIVKSIISAKLGKTKTIFARKCKVVEVEPRSAMKFLEETHLQGSVGSSKRLGLEHDGKLIALLTVGKSRFEKDALELIRFSSAIGITVVGGLSKLLKALDLQQDLVSYADRRFSIGNGYLKAGFELLGKTPPAPWWTDKTTKFSRFQLQKHKLKDILASFDETKTANENLRLAGYRKFYDCGHLKLILRSS